MKTIVKFNKGNQQVQVSNAEITQKTSDVALLEYLEIRDAYAKFCAAQTKTGQARKNERARKRKAFFNSIDTDSLDVKLINITNDIKKEKTALIEKIEVEIEFDGRKKRNLSKIVEGIRMAIFVGGLSPQYYGLGLINFQIKQTCKTMTIPTSSNGSYSF